MCDKQVIRREIAILKRSLTDESAGLLSARICSRLVQTPEFVAARCIALYSSLPDEVRTLSLIEEWHTLKRIVLPIVSGDDISFHLYSGRSRMVKGAFDIVEPFDTKYVAPADIDLFVVPGVAFDRDGNRLGRGKGFYDRYLASINKPVIGLCFGFQFLDRLPNEPHDIKMTKIISDAIS